MMRIEIPPNPNCAPVELRVFHDLEPPRPVTQVRLERQAPSGQPSWCDVTGWTLDARPCPALLRKIDDSGEGVAFLLSGGEAGLRLRLSAHPTPWRLEDPRQWGDAFIILTDLGDVRVQEAEVTAHG